MPKNIVVLSDGTGNSAAKAHKTNVWRLYQALEKRDPAGQVIMYDDGVGSQGDTRMAAFAGAFGFGLRRNIIELYAFLCRNYEPGDQIYVFGFSRGAFTVRLLAGMALKRGLLDTPDKISNAALYKLAKHEYHQYRRSYDRALLSKLFRPLIYGKDDKGVAKHDDVGIRFMGVWDTVDAYGLPNDELAVLWDRLIFQMRFDDQNLNSRVERACQALAIDDERFTFHPLVWNENLATPEFDPAQSPSDVRQVWFAGAHSDVGGGYPEPELALISLEWMIAQVDDCATDDGLCFIPGELERQREQATAHGKQHNARKGLKALYRYKPRYIDRLSDDAAAGVKVDLPKIHASVIERAREDIVPYAPLSLPERYEVVTTDGSPPPAAETEDAQRDRFLRQERARDSAFWGAGVYNAFVAAILLVVCSPLYLSADVVGAEKASERVVERAVIGLDYLLPDFADRWLDVFEANAGFFIGIVVLFAVLFYLRAKSANRTRRLANAAWIDAGPPPSPAEAESFTRKLRRMTPTGTSRLIYMGLTLGLPLVAAFYWS